MATRVQNVQNGQKNVPFRLPPLCSVELKPKTWQNVPPRGFSRTTPPRGPKPTPRSPWARPAARELAYRAGPTGTLPHSKKLQRGDSRKGIRHRKIVYVQKRTERAHFLFWPARTNMEGVGSGRGTNIYAYWRLRVRIPLCTCDFFCWLLVLWGASRSARKKASCARPHWRKLRVWGLAAGRLFFPDFFRCVFCGL